MGWDVREWKMADDESITYPVDGKRQRGPKASEFVYFIQAEVSGLIKIGVARNMVRRLAALQTGNPDRLVVLGVIRDDSPIRLESMLHSHFRAYHHVGEWFRPNAELDAFMKEYARTPEEDEADQREEMMRRFRELSGSPLVKDHKAKRMSRADKLARYKAARGIVD
jgi:hypothetical protein